METPVGSGARFRVQGSRFGVLGFWVRGSEVQRFWVRGSGFRVQGSRFQVDGFVKSPNFPFFVIPAKAGIQYFAILIKARSSATKVSDTFYDFIKVPGSDGFNSKF
jgi:hypothetical protein